MKYIDSTPVVNERPMNNMPYQAPGDAGDVGVYVYGTQHVVNNEKSYRSSGVMNNNYAEKGDSHIDVKPNADMAKDE
jgi:hypothetical protein